MIIVAGHLRVTDRDAFLAHSRHAVALARDAAGCHDFAVSGDLVDPERVNVFERWSDRDALHAFRGDGLDDDLSALVSSADVREFEVRADAQTP